jgi:hypothetical protein
MAPFTRRQRSIDDRSNSHPNEPKHGVPYFLAHPSNLSVFSFMYNYSQNTRLNLAHIGRRSNFAVQIDTYSQSMYRALSNPRI